MKNTLGLVLVGALAVQCTKSPPSQTQPSQTQPASQEQSHLIRIGATPVPHEELLKELIEPLKNQGIELKIITFDDYVQPNLQLAEGKLHANFYQTLPYLEDFCTHHRVDLVSLIKVHIEPMGIYSRKVKQLSILAQGAQVAIPSDASNGGRALLLLQQEGLLKLKEGVSMPQPRDVTSNPKKLRIKEVDAAMLPRVLEDVDLACINSNFALQAHLSPTQDSLALENKDAPYANVLVARRQDQNNPDLQKLAKALHSPHIKAFMTSHYKGAVVPAF